MTWLKAIGEWHQKFSEWALEENISTWQVIVDAIFKLIAIYGIILTFFALFGRFIFKNCEENTED